MKEDPPSQSYGATRAIEESANLPAPEIIAADIVEDLEAALQQFAAIAQDLKNDPGTSLGAP